MESGDGSGDGTVKSCEVSSGCGCNSNGTNVPANATSSNSNLTSQIVDESILVRVTPTTGGQFDVLVCKNESVENLKKRLSKKLKVPKERICLLHRDRQLRDGTLQENQLVDGSRLTLLPSVETGLLAQRPEQSVMQALESLNDSQVNDFLSGKAPLNLTMRLGDHMMLIQLQLSTVTPKLSTNSSRTRTSATSSPQSSRVRTQAPVTPPNTILTPPPTPPSSTPSTPSTSSNNTPKTSPTTSNCRCDTSKQPALDTRALAEASRNLTQTLKQLSSEVLTSRGSSNSSSIINATSTSTSTSPLDLSEVRRQASSSSSNTATSRSSTSAAPTSTTSSTSTPTSSRAQANSASDRAANTESSRRRQGAIIESMHHHGKGVYSGTFSGTLNPALQDKFGRPKRDISTIIHILNDLLCATPQYRGASAASARAARQAAAAAAAHEAATLEHDLAEGEDSAQLSKENQATRGKMEQLRQIMEERRQRRRARREARVAPYSAAQWAASKATPPASSPTPSPAPTEERPCEARASIAASATEDAPMETEGGELCELNPEPVLA